MTGLEERDPVGDHLRRVARRRPVPGREQRDVALAGPVEAVTVPQERPPGSADNAAPQTGQARSATARGSSGGAPLTSAAGRRGR